MRAVRVEMNIRVGTKRKIKSDLRTIISGSKTGSSYNLINRYDIIDNKIREKIKMIIFVRIFRLNFSDCMTILDIFKTIIYYALSVLLPCIFKNGIIKATLFLYTRKSSPYLDFKAISSIFPKRM